MAQALVGMGNSLRSGALPSALKLGQYFFINTKKDFWASKRI